jgi:hypothetical protein
LLLYHKEGRLLLRTLALSSALVSSACFLLPAEIAREGQITQLPVRKVVLYKNGVGYFEHEGRVVNNEAVSIDFTSSQLNDVLQSLTALDLGGGRIAGVNYNSTSPIEQQLKTIPLGLGDDPSTADVFAALRGARVEVSGSGIGVVSGRLLNLEVTSEQKDNNVIIEHRRLTVVSDAGAVRTFELTPSLSVRVLDSKLQHEMDRYLDLLASTRNQQMRHLTLEAHGTGARDIRVSYISEVPVWKSTYRIVFPKASQAGETATAILQGWAVVDNTVGSDWDNVQLSLVAGAPQSFVQSLSQPYYTRRPEIGLPESAMLTPQTHESAMTAAGTAVPQHVGMASESVMVNGSAVGSPMPLKGNQGFAGGVLGTGAGGVGLGSGGGMGGGTYHPAAAPPPPVQDETGSTNTTGFDDYFEYALAQPITIHKNQSALVPVLQTNVQAERVTLWSWTQPQSLRALWLTNTSNMTLDRGSFSIFENGEFAGEGLLDPIHASEKRLLSYAVDQAVQVKVAGMLDSQHLHHVIVHDGVLIEQDNEVSERTYVVHNAAAEMRNVVIEHPVRDGWKLTSEVKPVETSASSYRFRVVTQPNETVSLHVGEAHTLSTRYALTAITDDQMQWLIRGSSGSPELRQKLQPIFDAKRQLNDLDRQIKLKQDEIGRVVEDQKRLHDNLSGLKDTAEERQLAKRYAGEMNADEDQLQTLKGQLADLERQHTAAQQGLDETIRTLNLDMDVTAA